MGESSAALHEAAEVLGPERIDRHRAIVSLMEELEAVDWYDQRVAATEDETLRAILEHNRDEEKEHASMLLEWLRRSDPALDTQLRAKLFTNGPVAVEESGASNGAASPDPAPRSGDGSLGLGSLRRAELSRPAEGGE